MLEEHQLRRRQGLEKAEQAFFVSVFDDADLQINAVVGGEGFFDLLECQFK